VTRPPTPEQALIRRTARRITLQVAALFTICLLALAGLAAAFIVRQQNSDGQRLLSAAVADEDAVTDPPSGIVIYESDGGRDRSSPALGGRPLDAAALAAVRRGHPTIVGRVAADGREYQLRTARRGTATVQAGLDLTDRDRERRHLIDALIIAGLTGTAVALAIGHVVARRAVRPLEMASVRQRRFVADASHELRTPLTQAHTRAQMIQRSLAASGTDPDLVDEAGRMVRSTRQLGDIIEELLLSAQMSADPRTVVPVDLATVAADAVEAEAVRASARDITVTVVHDVGPHVVAGSATALRRVFNSLIDNAFGHVEPGGHITVTLNRGDTDPPTVVASVTDDGHGFDAGDAGKMFERFARGDHGDARRYGLGLALAREVVQAHRGTIVAIGAPEQGAVFTITLPAAAGPA
jgi:two-component system, OmpR family, sensor kinase